MAEKSTSSIMPWDNEALQKLLLELIAYGTETLKVDCKLEIELATNEQKTELLKDITAVANSYDESYDDYGFLIYGVSGGKIVGTSKTETNADTFQNHIEQLLRENIYPMPQIYVVPYEEATGEKWGAVVIAPRNNRPYMFYKEMTCQNPKYTRRKGEWFVRKGATSSPGLPEDLNAIVQRQMDLQLIPMKEGIRALQARVEKIESQYDSALFRLVERGVSAIEGKEPINTEKEGEKENVVSPIIARAVFPLALAKDGPARFRAPKEALGFEDDSFGDNEREIFLSAGPAMWLRVFPATNQQREWSTKELRRVALEKSHLLPLIHPSGGYSYLRASDGIGMYRANGDKTDSKTYEVESAAFAFKTGEVWSIETALLSWDKERLYQHDTEKAFVQSLGNYGLFLKELGIEAPFHWKAGLVGVKGRRLGYPPPPGKGWIQEKGPLCAADLIEAEGTLEDGQNPSTALLPFFEKIFEECGRERPDYLPQ